MTNDRPPSRTITSRTFNTVDPPADTPEENDLNSLLNDDSLEGEIEDADIHPCPTNTENSKKRERSSSKEEEYVKRIRNDPDSRFRPIHTETFGRGRGGWRSSSHRGMPHIPRGRGRGRNDGRGGRNDGRGGLNHPCLRTVNGFEERDIRIEKERATCSREHELLNVFKEEVHELRMEVSNLRTSITVLTGLDVIDKRMLKDSIDSKMESIENRLRSLESKGSARSGDEPRNVSNISPRRGEPMSTITEVMQRASQRYLDSIISF